MTRTISQKASQRAKPISQQAQHAITVVRDSAKTGAQTTGKAESTLVTSARAATTKIGSLVRAKPAPVLAAAGAATLAVMAYRRRHRK